MFYLINDSLIIFVYVYGDFLTVSSTWIWSHGSCLFSLEKGYLFADYEKGNSIYKGSRLHCLFLPSMGKISTHWKPVLIKTWSESKMGKCTSRNTILRINTVKIKSISKSKFRFRKHTISIYVPYFINFICKYTKLNLFWSRYIISVIW